MSENTFVVKASGEEAPFSINKLRHSLRRAGAGKKAANRIAAEIQQILYPGISTREIYRGAFSMLKNASPHTAARYRLKKAIMELGPTGFPFEKFVGEILKEEGYRVQVGQMVQGHCVQHEVDVIAEKDSRHFMIECKFHSGQERKCDVKSPLYIHSRFKDIERAWLRKPGHGQKFHQGWLVTNTRFTTDAMQYGACAGLNLVSWNHPRKDNLKERISRLGLYPLTCLATLTKKEKQSLLDKGIVLCKELCRNEQWLKEMGLPPSRIGKVMEEASSICESTIQQ